MNEPRSKWDYPVTDTELDAHYGVPYSQEYIDGVIGEESANVDMNEITDSMFDYHDLIMDAIADKDAEAVGNIVLLARRARIADMASRRLYGKDGVIIPSEVKV